MSFTVIALGIGMSLVQTESQVPVAEEVTVTEEYVAPAVQVGIGDSDEWLVKRVAGDPNAMVTFDVGAYRFDRMVVETSLPEGYPTPTPPTTIELKRYPQVRRAEFTQVGDPDRGRNRAFWPLFNHIKGRDIAMTSPVELEIDGWGAAADSGMADTRWTMAFLYRSRDLGAVGDDGKVLVADSEPLTVLSIGVRGAYGMDRLNAAADELAAWLGQQDEWQAAGDVRALLYNGPYVAARNKWSEVQVPVVKASSGKLAASGISESDE